MEPNSRGLIDGFQSRDDTAMLVHKTIANMAHVLRNNRVKFPKDFFLYCSVHQRGRSDVVYDLCFSLLCCECLQSYPTLSQFLKRFIDLPRITRYSRSSLFSTAPFLRQVPLSD